MGMFGPVQKGGSSVPPGIYKAEFLGIDAVPENVEKGFKAGFCFKFKVLEGPQSGETAQRIMAGPKPTLRNGLGKFLSEMTGIAVAEGVDYETDPLIGKPFTIVVKAGEQSGTRVDTVMAIK
jgi:hypothetical protein